jgi:dienelactone hydrolase
LACLLANAPSQATEAASRADELVVVAPHIADSKEPPLGYLARPDAIGRLPAVVVLHGCDGFHSNMPTWAMHLRSWGYVALAIDTLTPRHIANGCEGGANDEPIDAFTALRYLQAQSYVDPARVALLGFSRGGGSALLDVDAGSLAPLFPTKFRAAIAYYPICSGISGVMTAPTLILGGEEDDWLPIQECRDMMARRDGKGAPVTLVVYPGATHAFNIDASPRVYLGHHLRYDAAAAQDAETWVRAFLHARLQTPADTQAVPACPPTQAECHQPLTTH